MAIKKRKSPETNIFKNYYWFGFSGRFWKKALVKC